MRPPDRARHCPRCILVAALLLASCASVTRSSSFDVEPGRSWIRNTVGTKIVVESAPGVSTSGRLVDAAAGVVRFQGDDPNPIAIPVRSGARLREPRRGLGALLGALTGVVTGGVVGVILMESLGTPNPDSAGGVERPPLVLPVSLLAGIVLGSVTGYLLGFERRLELDSVSSP